MIRISLCASAWPPGGPRCHGGQGSIVLSPELAASLPRYLPTAVEVTEQESRGWGWGGLWVQRYGSRVGSDAGEWRGSREVGMGLRWRGSGGGVLPKGDGAVQTDSADFRKGQSCNPHRSNAQLRPRERGWEGGSEGGREGERKGPRRWLPHPQRPAAARGGLEEGGGAG